MKKGVKIVGIILGIIILLGIIFFAIDYNRARNNEQPMFCVQIDEVNDGGSKIYLGLGYKVIDFNTLSGFDDVKIGTWFMNYDDFNEERKIFDDKYNKKQYLESKNISSIVISETGVSSARLAKSYNLNQDEMYALAKLLDSLSFSKPNETCDGLSNYVIKYNNGDMTYGIEVYDDVTHIVRNGGGEAILNDKQREQVNEILKNLEA